MNRLQGKVAIVTGAARGIGAAIARRYAEEGANLVLCDLDADIGEATAEALRAEGAEVRFTKADVGDKSQAVGLVDLAAEAFGRLDVLVNNAGTMHKADLLDLEEDDFDRVMRTNVKGPFLCSQAAARRMVDQGEGGAIVNITSINAILTIPDQIPYNVSKGGLTQLTRVTAVALAHHNIRVNAIGPGTIETEMAKVVMQDRAARHLVLSRTPLGRVGDPAEIASVAAFLASDDAS